MVFSDSISHQVISTYTILLEFEVFASLMVSLAPHMTTAKPWLLVVVDEVLPRSNCRLNLRFDCRKTAANAQGVSSGSVSGVTTT